MDKQAQVGTREQAPHWALPGRGRYCSFRCNLEEQLCLCSKGEFQVGLAALTVGCLILLPTLLAVDS